MQHRTLGALIVAGLMAVTVGNAGGQDRPVGMPGGLLRYPDISATHIVFGQRDMRPDPSSCRESRASSRND